MIESDRFLEVAIVARKFGVTSTTVRNWIKAGKLVATITPSGRYRITCADLLSAIRKAKKTKEAKVTSVQC